MLHCLVCTIVSTIVKNKFNNFYKYPDFYKYPYSFSISNQVNLCFTYEIDFIY